MKTRIKKGDIIKIVVLALVIIWIIIFFIDYFRARQSKTPIFCLFEETKEQINQSKERKAKKKTTKKTDKKRRLQFRHSLSVCAYNKSNPFY